jgi:2-oxoglutarate ferredoxin oxidoreductase subunit beta
MSKKNPEYDFKWCPGCGDFGVRRAIEMAMQQWMVKTEIPVEQNVVVAGIGCSGNTVHLLEGQQPYGFHGIHGRSLPLALGVKMGNPDLNVLVVAGDGDFLSIGGEHIAPQAARNLDVCVVIMDNGVYGLTKGQSSPTTELGTITSSTPFGKVETPVHPLNLFMTLGVSFVASSFSSKVKEMADLILQGMEHPGFAIVHVNSPCTTYNDTYSILKGDPKNNIAPLVYDIPAEHDSGDRDAAFALVQADGIPLGLVYKDPDSSSFEQRLAGTMTNVKARTTDDIFNALVI